MGSNEQSPDSTAVFIEELGLHLSKQDGVDPELANIISTHLLQVAPAQDVVSLTKAAIVKLAAQRAASPKDNAHG
ncbi:hypothetical protein AYJ54_05200 [Bradyrhizobium centrolobii]|uniref:Uncharacterized protein n=1 Tax=Bradyrhizobium centrolobii TaxID=1505087 RepID=A0A176Z8R8_9BRAD|nr:hypothetical protein [Bradyrhizobium centrolobii]OAF16554.1 hypothetical protein AYJ54_05200 [Bradyrhizobium centrolobii]